MSSVRRVRHILPSTYRIGKKAAFIGGYTGVGVHHGNQVVIGIDESGITIFRLNEAPGFGG